VPASPSTTVSQPAPTTTTTTTTTVPPTPGPPGTATVLSVVAGNGSVTVSWSPPASDGGAPVSSYTVTADTGQSCTVTVSPGVPDRCTVTGLTNGQSYTFDVTATNAAGPGPSSNPAHAVVPSTVPGAPTGVSAAPGNASATISWNPPSDDGGAAVTDYTVTASGGAGQTCTYHVTVPETDQCTVPGLANGTSYTFTVVATNVDGDSPGAIPSPAIVPSTVPNPPTGVVASAGDQQATVSWVPPVDDGGLPVVGYTVTASGGVQHCTSMVSTPEVDSCTVVGLTAGTSYTFTVVATNATGTSWASTPSPAVIPTTVPGAPTGVSAVPGNQSAVVSWSPPPTDGGSPVLSDVVTPSGGAGPCTEPVGTPEVDACTVTGLTNGTGYTFTVTAVNADGPGVASAPTPTVTPAAVPGPPTAVTAVASNGTATVSWVAPADDGGSPILSYSATAHGDGGNQTCTDVLAPLTDTCVVSGLTDGTSYTFTVTATNLAGTGPPSAASNPVVPSTLPGAPQAVAATPGDASATVTWTPPAGDGGTPITAYTVTASGDGGNQTCTYLVTTPETDTCTVGGLTDGTAYTFSVTATNVNGTGPASAPSAPVTPATVPGAPLDVSATAGNASAAISWVPPTSDGGATITAYTVTASGDGGNETCTYLVTTPETDTCTVGGLTDGTAYTFTVTATNQVGTGAPSAPSSAVTPVAGTSSLTITNGPGNAGRADQGDVISVTFATPPDPSALCSLWSSGSTPALTGSSIVITGTKGAGPGNDQISSVADSACASGFHFGTIDLGQKGYFNGTVTITGGSITWTNGDTLTITLGSPSTGDPTEGVKSVAVYTPDPALGPLGTISSINEVQF
jgi:hypothetical protein